VRIRPAVLLEALFGFGDLRRVPEVAEAGLVTADEDDGAVLAGRVDVVGLKDPQHRRCTGVWGAVRRRRTSQSVHVESARDHRMGLVAALVLQVAAVNFQRCQQRHHLPEDLLV